jgi:UDP-N-acetylmuramyl tripeptide synthase
MAAWVTASQLGCDPDATKQVFQAKAAAFGRGEQLAVDGANVQLLLVKNPTGANEVVRALASGPGGITIQFVLNDRIADGRDVSWIWDADFEDLAAKTDLLVCSGSRADEAALRFLYAGVPSDRIKVIEESRAGLRAAAVEAREVWVLPTYTAMLELRAALTREGAVEKVV